MKKKTAVKVTDLSKKFKIYHEKPALINIWKRKRYNDLWALKNINFQVSKGETVSIIGRNGSGKSTLLKILCGVMTPTSGSIKTHGRIASLLELGAGFHPELTGRENIFLNASIMNLSKKEIHKKFDDIVSFSQLEDFIDTPLYTYSSGMYVRLGFAIAVFTNFDILIIDEILSVGDTGFQEKCVDKIMEFKNSGKTIIFVTHDLGTAEKLSDRILWLEKGRLKWGKEKQYIIDSYLEMFFRESEQDILKKEQDNKNLLTDTIIKSPTVDIADEKQSETDNYPAPEKETKLSSRRWGSNKAEITKVTLYNRTGEKTRIFRPNDEFIILIKYFAHKKISNPVFGVSIHREDGVNITGPNTMFSGYTIKYIEGAGSVEYKILKLPLLPGTYLITAAIYDKRNYSPFDHHDMMYKFKVVKGSEKEKYGILKISCKWNHKQDK